MSVRRLAKQSYHATKENDFGDELHDEISEDEAGFDNICVVCLQIRQEIHVFCRVDIVTYVVVVPYI